MKKEYSRIPDLSPQLNEQLRKLFTNPEIFKSTTTTPTTDNIDEGEFKIYNDGTDKHIYTKIGSSLYRVSLSAVS